MNDFVSELKSTPDTEQSEHGPDFDNCVYSQWRAEAALSFRSGKSDQLQPQLQPQPQLGSFATGFDLFGNIRQASTKRGPVSGSSPSRGCVSLKASMILVCSRLCRSAASGSDAESSLSRPGIGACFPFGWLPLGCGSKLQTSAFVNFGVVFITPSWRKDFLKWLVVLMRQHVIIHLFGLYNSVFDLSDRARMRRWP
jgi:hypothetical protein